jgi:acetolactate synthase-1/2/3 large subunit
MTNPDFILLARSMGVHAIRCHNADELPAKMKEFLEYDGTRPVLMECLVDKEEHVFPMVGPFCSIFRFAALMVGELQVAAGKALHEQLLHPSLTAIPAKAKPKA